jgi:hypothetical protein
MQTINLQPSRERSIATVASATAEERAAAAQQQHQQQSHQQQHKHFDGRTGSQISAK